MNTPNIVLPVSQDPYCNQLFIEEWVHEFVLWMSTCVHGRVVMFINEELKKAKVLPREWLTRYSVQGRRFIRSKLYRKYREYIFQPGTFLTLTYDPKIMGKAYMWKHLGEHRREFLKELWKHRRRVPYIWVVEEHKSGCPHLHIVFPGTTWLIHKHLLDHLWRWGMTNVKATQQGRGINYILKYVGKVRDDGIMLAMLWKHRGRMYQTTRIMFGGGIVRQGGWSFQFESVGSWRDTVVWLRSEGYEVEVEGLSP